LNACLDDLKAQGGADQIVAAGDLCLDGPRSREVLERLEAIGAPCVRGNTDRMIGEIDAPIEDEEDAEGVEFQRAQIGDGWTRWLRDLPFSLRVGEGPEALLVVHANPKSDDEYIFPDADDATLERVFSGVEERTLAFGHLHLSYTRMWRDRLLVNVASAGLPKDGDARACYAIFTQRSGGWEVKHRRVVFDVDKVAREIEKSGIPRPKRRVDVLRRHRYKFLKEQIP
jgi:diadenosine tetraphosphatase ApaH/serine/threonine PP2A family protein phosphatase